MTTTEPNSQEPSGATSTRRRLSARLRILGWYAVLLVLAGLGEIVIQRQVLLNRLDREIELALALEVDEVRLLAAGTDPNTGQPFGADSARIFDVFLDQNLPGEGEALLTFVGGEPYKATRSAAPLLDHRELMLTWRGLTAQDSDEVLTDAGPVRYQAVPLLAGGEVKGVFVVANLLRQELQEIDQSVQIGALAWLSLLGLASLVAWWVAGQVLAPIRVVTDTAKELTESDLSHRIPVNGTDEVAQLADTFNGMLDRLEDAFRSQRAFLDDASHELRTPITVIRGHLDLMGEDPDERRETIALVTDELSRMARLVDELLLLARAEQHDFLHLEQFDLDLLTREILLKAHGMGNREWTLEGSGYGVMVADRQRLTQAMINLIDNALRHTEPASLIGVGSSMSNGEVRLWVHDSGPGVPPAERERIFERFARRADGKRQPGSAGLGLTITRTIAEAHGGSVEVDGGVGAGCSFTLVLPAAPDEKERRR